MQFPLHHPKKEGSEKQYHYKMLFQNPCFCMPASYIDNELLYIRLFTCHVLSMMVYLIYARNPSESIYLLYRQECVKFMRLQFLRLWYSCQHSRKWKQAEKNWYRLIQIFILDYIYLWHVNRKSRLSSLDHWFKSLKEQVIFMLITQFNESTLTEYI